MENEAQWERHAALVAARVLRRRRPRVRGPDPAAGRCATSEGRDASSTSDAAKGQVARRLASGGAEVVGLDPTAAQVDGRPCTRRRAASTSGPGPRRCRVRDGSFDTVLVCLALEHVEAFEDAIDEVARVLEPGGRFVLAPLPPAPAGPGQRLDRRPDPRRDVLAGRRLPHRGATLRRGGARGRPPLRPPPPQPLRPRHGSSRPADRRHGRGGAAGSGDRRDWGFPEAATIPRVLLISASPVPLMARRLRGLALSSGTVELGRRGQQLGLVGREDEAGGDRGGQRGRPLRHEVGVGRVEAGELGRWSAAWCCRTAGRSRARC